MNFLNNSQNSLMKYKMERGTKITMKWYMIYKIQFLTKYYKKYYK